MPKTTFTVKFPNTQFTFWDDGTCTLETFADQECHYCDKEYEVVLSTELTKGQLFELRDTITKHIATT